MNATTGGRPAHWLQEGLRLHQGGRLAEAEAHYRRVLEGDKRHFEALHLLGVCRHQRGDFADAQKLLKAALKLRPDVAAAHLNYGNVLRELARLPEALDAYGRAARLDPALAVAHYNQGTALEELGRAAAALQHYDRAIACGADAAALTGRGNCLQALDRADEAVLAYQDAIARDPRHVDAPANLAAVLAKQRRHEEALAAAERALALDPQHVGATLNRVIALNELGRSGEALAAVERALAVAEPTVEVLYQRARTLARLQRGEEALALLERALALDPRHWASRLERAGVLNTLGRIAESEALYETMLAERPHDPEAMMQRGLLVLFQGDAARGRAAMEQALALQPDLPLGQYNLAFVDLVEGRYESGWRRYEQRWDEPAMRPHRRTYAQRPWRGQEDIRAHTLLVYAEQGSGDTIQFCRFLPLLREHAGRVVLEAPLALAGLLRRSLPEQIRVVTPGEAIPPFDRHCPLMSLPLALGITLENLPAPASYLAADPRRQDVWRNRLSDTPGPRIGLAWSGNPRHARDRERSIALASLLPMMQRLSRHPALGGVQFLGLQNELRPEDRVALAQEPAFQYFGEAIDDFEDSAALIALCDLVVSVDTAPLHLAGALGTPAWLLVARMPDWRWLLERPDSPWYPSVRVVRQEQRGNWERELLALEHELTAHLCGQGFTHPGAAVRAAPAARSTAAPATTAASNP